MDTNQHESGNQSEMSALKRAEASAQGRGVHAASPAEANLFVSIGVHSWF
jgi:hypothetical protein